MKPQCRSHFEYYNLICDTYICWVLVVFNTAVRCCFISSFWRMSSMIRDVSGQCISCSKDWWEKTSVNQRGIQIVKKIKILLITSVFVSFLLPFNIQAQDNVLNFTGVQIPRGVLKQISNGKKTEIPGSRSSGKNWGNSINVVTLSGKLGARTLELYPQAHAPPSGSWKAPSFTSCFSKRQV